MYLPVHSLNILYWHHEELDSVEFKKRYKTLIQDLDTRRPLRRHFYVVFFLRRIAFVGILVVFAFFPRLQMGLMLT